MTSTILVDADACPVKEEIYKVAYRTDTPVVLVSNSYLRLPDHPLLSQIVVSDGFDAADDHIAETAPFTENSIGSAVATRAIMADLRAGGDQVGGSAPFSKADRSRFLQALDTAVVRLKRAG